MRTRASRERPKLRLSGLRILQFFLRGDGLEEELAESLEKACAGSRTEGGSVGVTRWQPFERSIGVKLQTMGSLGFGPLDHLPHLPREFMTHDDDGNLRIQPSEGPD